jgi:hypothetical protein
MTHTEHHYSNEEPFRSFYETCMLMIVGCRILVHDRMNS